MPTSNAKLTPSPCLTQPAGTDAPARQPYEPPTLIPYGSLSELTQAVGNTANDGAIGTAQEN
jgi:hypothetical protein